MFLVRAKLGAKVLLAASWTMIIQPSCSRTPQSPSPEPQQIVTRIRTTDGMLYVTSRYSVQDSVVVIEDILRGEKYYPDPDEPHLYQKPEPVKQPPEDIQLPLRIPGASIVSIEPWKGSHKTRDGILTGVALAVAVVFLALAAYASAFGSAWSGD